MAGKKLKERGRKCSLNSLIVNLKIVVEMILTTLHLQYVAHKKNGDETASIH